MINIKTIYLAHKYTEPEVYKVQRNINKARLYAEEISALGALPLTPGLISAHFEGLQHYQWWCDAYLMLMRKCDAVFMVPGYEKSNGALIELTDALRLGMPVFYNLPELKQWLQTQESPDTVYPLV